MIPADPIPLKPGDPHTRRFIRDHGTTAYELDAFHPTELQKLVRISLMAFTDMLQYEENIEKELDDIDTLEVLRVDVEDYINHKIHELVI